MNREGIENIKGALKIISEQCKETFSCENCPWYDCKDLNCEYLVDCIPDH